MSENENVLIPYSERAVVMDAVERVRAPAGEPERGGCKGRGNRGGQQEQEGCGCGGKVARTDGTRQPLGTEVQPYREAR